MELVIGPDLLQLTVGVDQRLPVPQPDVVDGGGVGRERLCRKILLGGESLHRNVVQIVGALRRSDVALDVRSLELQLARSHVDALEKRRTYLGQQKRRSEQQDKRGDRKAEAARAQVGPAAERSDESNRDEQPKHRQRNMNVGI